MLRGEEMEASRFGGGSVALRSSTVSPRWLTMHTRDAKPRNPGRSGLGLGCRFDCGGGGMHGELLGQR